MVQENKTKLNWLAFSTFPSRAEYEIPEAMFHRCTQRRLLVRSVADDDLSLTRACACETNDRPISWHVGTCAKMHATTHMHEAFLAALHKEIKMAGGQARLVKATEFTGTKSCPDIHFQFQSHTSEWAQEGYGDLTVGYSNARSKEAAFAKDAEAELTGTKSKRLIEGMLTEMESRKEKKCKKLAARTRTPVWGLALSSGVWAGPRLNKLFKLIADMAKDLLGAPTGIYRAALNQRMSVAFHRAKDQAFRAAIGAYTKESTTRRTTKLPRCHVLHAPLEKVFTPQGGGVRGFGEGGGWGASR